MPEKTLSEDAFEELDATGLRCPLPLLKTRQALRTLSPGQLLRVQMAPVRQVGSDAAEAQTLAGFVLMLDNITREFEAESARDQVLHTLTEGSRSALANMQAAIDMLDYPDLEAAMRERFLGVIREETRALSQRIGALEAGSADSLKTRWPLEDMLGADLVSAALRRIETVTRLSASSMDVDGALWLKVESFSLLQALVSSLPLLDIKTRNGNAEELREQVAAEHPHLVHDFTQQRLISLQLALERSGDDVSRADEAFEAFFASRNQVDFYPDALAALARLSARWPVAALTNGNADLARIGIHGHFQVFVSAREQGIAKPEAPIFHATCERLGVAPHEVLHVGDDPLLDVHGARRAGLRSCWINRKRESWPLGLPRPDLEFATLAGLADWLDARHPVTETR